MCRYINCECVVQAGLPEPPIFEISGSSSRQIPAPAPILLLPLPLPLPLVIPGHSHTHSHSHSHSQSLGPVKVKYLKYSRVGVGGVEVGAGPKKLLRLRLQPKRAAPAGSNPEYGGTLIEFCCGASPLHSVHCTQCTLHTAHSVAESFKADLF